MTHIDTCIETGGSVQRRLLAGLISPLMLLNRALASAHDGLCTWSERAYQRRNLNSMPEYLLRDIGLSRADIVQEIDKPFWRA